MKPTRPAPSDSALRTGAILAVVAALVGTVSWAFLARTDGSRHAREQSPEPRSALAASSSAAARQETAPTTQASPEPILARPVAPPVTSGARPRSPLERSPGYYPPDDPESMSVVTGRRNAPAVDLELTGGASSIENLARLLLDDLQARNEGAMHALRLTKHEFAVICWPEFPESRPITHITVDDAWEFQAPTSLAGSSRAISAYGGRDLSLLNVQVGRVETFRNFTLHREVTLVVRDNATKETIGLRFVPSIVERHGHFKALLFKD